MSTGTTELRGSGRASLISKLRELWTYRELLVNLTKRELKVRYKNSALGFLWSMLNPLLYLVIFSVVLGVFLGFSLPWFAFYLLSGLIAWNFLGAGIGGAAGSIVGNANLVTKVYFPREILPLSAIGAALFHFLLQLLVLTGAMLITNYTRFWDEGMILLPLAMIVQIIFVVGLGLIVASVNVFFRDVQYLIELGLLAWFWMTPIVYASAWVQERLAAFPAVWGLYLSNPMTGIALALQRALYGQTSPAAADGQAVPVLIEQPVIWYATRLGYVAVGALLLLVVGWLLFRRLQPRLAEEL